VNQPSNWSQVRIRTKGKASIEEIQRSVIAARAANHAMASWNIPGIRSFDWEPTSPPNIRGAPKGASLTSSAPLSSPELTGRRANSILNGRAREPMSFWDTEWQQRSDQDPQ